MNLKSRINSWSANPQAYKWSAFTVVAIATLMQAMDFSLINISYPILTGTFKTQLATVVWLNLIFSLIVISFGPFFGKLIDIVGRKKIFVIGSGLMTLGLIACSLSQSIQQLIFFRIIYSIGSALITTCFAAIITDVFPANERGKGMGLWNASLSLGFTVAPFLAGILLSLLDWRSIFYTRIPIAVIIFFSSLILLKKDKKLSSDLKFDYTGTVTSSAGFLCLITGINLIFRYSIGSPIVYSLITAGFILIAIFIYTETKAESPILDLSLFKNISFLTASITIFLFWCSVQGNVVTTSFYLMETLGWPVSSLGIIFTISPVIMIIMSTVSGSLSDRVGSIPLMIISLALAVISLFIMWTYDRNTNLITILIVQIIAGVATGVFQPANNSLMMGSVQPEERGMASAMSASLTHFGLALGMAWAGMFYSIRLLSHKERLISQGIETAISVKQSVQPAFHDVIMVATFIQILTLIFSIVPVIKKKR
jgi:EmrB/QacA subfamily drug resistance transporter